MAYVKQTWQSNELLTSEKLNHMEDGIVAAKTSEDIVNNLSETTTGKILDATQGKVLNDSKLDKNFNFTAATLPYSNNEKIALLGTDGSNYYTTIGELASQIGGGGGTSQTALVHYIKNCGTISSLNWTNQTVDNNITENMVVLKAELSNPAAQTSDWTCTTTNGYVTISGTINGSTDVLLYFGVSLSTAPSIIVNLASNSSDNVLKTNPTPGVMGVLSKSNGGTGVNATDNADLLDKIGVTAAIQQSTAKVVTMVTTHNNTTDETISTYNNRDFSKVTGLLIFMICNADGLRTFATTVIPTERFTNGNSVVRFINIDNNNLVPITLTVKKVTNTSVQAKISSGDFYYRIEALGYDG